MNKLSIKRELKFYNLLVNLYSLRMDPIEKLSPIDLVHNIRMIIYLFGDFRLRHFLIGSNAVSPAV